MIEITLFQIERKVDLALRMLRQLHKEHGIMTQELDFLEAKIAPMGSAVDSAVALLTELTGMIRNAANDPQRILAVANEIEAKTSALADAVVANTPAAP